MMSFISQFGQSLPDVKCYTCCTLARRILDDFGGMLTPNDVHYLVGFLTLMSSPEDVEIVLGDLVHDSAVDGEREVDVTVTYKDPAGLTSVFKGIEVKRHHRPLDVTHVEQLAAKLRDMPNMNLRAIVSASGYTKTAQRKAAAHDVELFTFSDWIDTMEGFEHVKFAPGLTASQRTFTFACPPRIVLNPKEQVSSLIPKESLIRDSSGKEVPGCENLDQFMRNMELQALTQIGNQNSIKELQPGILKLVTISVEVSGEVFVELTHRRLQLREAVIVGPVVKIDSDLKPIFKILLKIGEQVPYAGCVIAELYGGTLIAIAVGNTDRSIKFFPIPISARNSRKIQALRLQPS